MYVRHYLVHMAWQLQFISNFAVLGVLGFSYLMSVRRRWALPSLHYDDDDDDDDWLIQLLTMHFSLSMGL